MNALFSNVHRQIHAWPRNHTYKHLKRQVLRQLVDDRANLAEKLKLHLNKSTFSYEEAVEEIRARDGDERIPAHLGDFILAATSLVIKHPITVIKPTMVQERDRNDVRRPVYGVEVEHLFTDDNRRRNKYELIMMIFNGLDHYAPGAPKEIATLTNASSTAKTSLGDAILQVEEMLQTVPPSPARQALVRSLKYMGAAKENLGSAKLTTGTALDTQSTRSFPVPTPLSSADAAKGARKRASSALQLAPPAKSKGESEKDFAAKKRKYTDDLDKQAQRCCKLAPNQCHCGEEYATREEMVTHANQTHVDPGTWQCPRCDKILGSKGKLWTHVRHHMGRWYFYCDEEYADPDDKDKDGNPKVKVCDVACDELSYMLYHKEVIHSLEPTEIRCRFCNSPQMTLRHKRNHEKICDQGETEAGANTDQCPYCDYGCRGRSTMRNHIRQKHHVEAGLPPPPTWECAKCHKKFTTNTSKRAHRCKVKKPRKPSAAKGKRKYIAAKIQTWHK